MLIAPIHSTLAQRPDTPEPFRAIQAELQALTGGATAPAIAMAVAHHGRIIWEAGFGFSDSAPSVPATAHTPFAVGSVAKSVTGVALMRLVERGVIALDTPLYRYLPSSPLTLEGDSAELSPAALDSLTGSILHVSRHIRSIDATSTRTWQAGLRISAVAPAPAAVSVEPAQWRSCATALPFTPPGEKRT